MAIEYVTAPTYTDETVTAISWTEETNNNNSWYDECLWKTVFWDEEDNEYMDDIDEISPDGVNFP